MREALSRLFLSFLIFALATTQVFATPVAIQKGEPAPEDGVFLSTKLAADILGRLESSTATCDALTDAARKKATAPLDLKLNLCLDKDKFNQELFGAKIAAKDEYITQLEKRVADPGISRSWVLLGGITLGVLLTMAAGVAMNNAAAN